MNFSLPIFDVKNISLYKKRQTILKNITLQIFEGEYVAIIGPNGGGKTTFIRTLLGLEKISHGFIYIYGKPLKKFHNWSEIGYVPQRATLIDKNFPATAYDIVKMGRIAAKKGFSSFFLNKEDEKSIYESMEKMGVLNLKNQLVGELSGGQRQRVMIARALSSHPKVLILDEPNTGVDQYSQKKFYTLLKELNQKENLTIVFITHDVGVIAEDITKLITINQKASICNNFTEMMSCQEVSQLYGFDAHVLSNHIQKGKNARI